MRLDEIKQPSDQKLFEEIDRENDTGFLTEDLVKVMRAGDWSKPMTSEELLESLGINANGEIEK